MGNLNRSTTILRYGLVLLALAGLAYFLTGRAHQGQSAANAASPAAVTSASEQVPAGDSVATFSGGCFWSMQAMFSRLKGVDSVVAGYAGGHTAKPTYEDVCTETTGHAETIQVIFNPKMISYRDLVSIFFHVHNPTTKDQQGDDIGTSYRSILFYHDADQQKVAQDVIAEITKSKLWPDPIVTEVVPFATFYRAEDYHQNYFAHNPDTGYCQYVVAPKVAKFRAEYASKLKPGA